jgi:hypothetical protein
MGEGHPIAQEERLVVTLKRFLFQPAAIYFRHNGQAYLYLHLYFTNINSVVLIRRRFSYRYLATGASFRHLAFEFRMGGRLYCRCDTEVCLNKSKCSYCIKVDCV